MLPSRSSGRGTARAVAGRLAELARHGTRRPVAAGGARGAEFSGYGKPIENPDDIERLFYEQIRVYNSYWRDDPEFDTTNLQAACPHLPCPTMNEELLLMLSTKALEMDFRWKDKPVKRAKVATEA